LGFELHALTVTVHDLLIDHQRQLAPESVIQHTKTSGFDVLPANIALAQAEKHLVHPAQP